MEEKKGQEQTGGGAADPASFDKAREIFHHFANTVSALKIFPPEHLTAVRFIDTLAEELRAYLGLHGKLEAGVEEYSFTLEGRPVYTDEMTIKSLPFFFFKDGIQILYFYQGLGRAELLDFIDLIRRESQKPAEDADIVTAMWERDFANIQYYAPEDYLETRILEERSESQAKLGLPVLPAEFAHEVIEVRVDTSQFTRGKIVLTEEDLAAVRKGTAAREPWTEAPAAADSGKSVEERAGRKKSPAASMDPALTETEVRDLETLIRRNRSVSPEEEFLDLMVEILFLENDPARFDANLSILEEYDVDRVVEGDFPAAILLIGKLRELQDHLTPSAPEKAGRIGSFLKGVAGSKVLDAVRTLFEEKRTVPWSGLVDFFRTLGAPALPLAADLYDAAGEGESRPKILDFISSEAPEAAVLVGLAADERPLLSREIIAILAAAGRKGLPLLSAFVNSKDRDIRLAAVAAIGAAGDESSNRLLAAFMKDVDEDVRVQAALRLNPAAEGSRIRSIIRDASGRGFKGRSLKEKTAVLTFLGRTRTAEALDFLRRTLLRRVPWSRTTETDLKLAAVSGLEHMATPEACRALEKGARSWNEAVRAACGGALARLASGGPESREGTAA